MRGCRKIHRCHKKPICYIQIFLLLYKCEINIQLQLHVSIYQNKTKHYFEITIIYSRL